MADWRGQSIAPHFRHSEAARVGAHLRDRSRCLQALAEWPTGRRPDFVAWLDGLSRARHLSDLRCHIRTETREERNRGVVGAGLVFHAIAVVPAGIQLRRYSSG